MVPPGTTDSLSSLTSGIGSLGSKALSAVPGLGQFGGVLSTLMGSLSKMFSGSGGGAGGGAGGGFLTQLAGLGGSAGHLAQDAGSAVAGAGGGGGGLFGWLGSLFSAFHGGGVVGRPSSMSRYVNPAIFHGAARFHDGLGDDEFPAILQRGERVLTANQDQRATAMMSRMADMIANSNASTPAGTQRPDSGRQNGGRNVTMIVNTPNASSFRSSQPQIMAQQHAALQRMGNRHN